MNNALDDEFVEPLNRALIDLDESGELADRLSTEW